MPTDTPTEPTVPDDCPCCGQQTQTYQCGREAMNRWNTRAPDADLDRLVVEAQNGLKEMETWLTVDECDCPPEGHMCGKPRLTNSVRKLESALVPYADRGGA